MSASGILTVCNANICRSVAAEFLLAEGVSASDSLSGIRVFSRGANAIEGSRGCRDVIEMHHGGVWADRAKRHRSRLLDTDAIAKAGLILTASMQVRAAVVSMAPSARRTVFTLREALWLAEGYPPSDSTGGDLVTDFASYLDGNRGLRPLPERRRALWRRAGHPFDIEDGHLQGGRAHTATLRQVQDTVSGLLDILAPIRDSLSTSRHSSP